MRNLFNLSIRHKVPLWGALLVVATAALVSGLLMAGRYKLMLKDQELNARFVGYALQDSLRSAIENDKLWHAYEELEAVVSTASSRDGSSLHPSQLMVLNRALHVVVASNPREWPIDTDIRDQGEGYRQMADALREIGGAGGGAVRHIGFQGESLDYFAMPLSNVGFLVMGYPKYSIETRFAETLLHGLPVALVCLALLLTINWYWGRWMVMPLVALTDKLSQVNASLPTPIEISSYPYHDEIGQLYAAYNVMVDRLKEHAELERELLQSERMVALGRVASGVAHEINNPLGGIFTAIDTLRSYCLSDPVALKTLQLVQRGLEQIKDTVSALLVHGRANARNLTAADIGDIYLLGISNAKCKQLDLVFHNRMVDEVPLPSTFLRQLMLNLLLNSIDAASRHVSFELAVADGVFALEVANDGQPISADLLPFIFEPFSRVSKTGHGLGLWITYQIVSQLGGNIEVSSNEVETKFSIRIPLSK